MATIVEKLDRLPPEALMEVEQFVDELIAAHSQEQGSVLKLTWAGGLKHLKGRYTSVELQHEILKDWVKIASS